MSEEPVLTVETKVEQVKPTADGAAAVVLSGVPKWGCIFYCRLSLRVQGYELHLRPRRPSLLS